MTTVDHPGDPRICSGVPHPIVSVSLTWCPHVQAWTVSLTSGEASGLLSAEVWPMGPFDDAPTALAFATDRLSVVVERIAPTWP